MDTWSLDLDVPDVERVIQWKVYENLDFSDLHQRIGKVAMDQNIKGVAQIYVQKNLLESMSRDWREEVVNWQDAWRNPDVLSSDSELSDTEDESESRYDGDGRRIRRWKKRPLGRFGLPIRHDTQDKVAVHVRHLYREAKIIRKGLQAARQERRRTGENKLSSIMKLDPAVLWFLCTRGCRHRLFRVIFHEPIRWEDSNISWCCDNCAIGEHMPSMISIPR